MICALCRSTNNLLYYTRLNKTITAICTGCVDPSFRNHLDWTPYPTLEEAQLALITHKLFGEPQ